MGKIQFGDKVRFARRMCRKTHGIIRHWEPVSWKGAGGTGIFLGYRAVQRGYVDGDECGNYFVEDGPRTRVAVVCTAPGKIPIYVDPEGLEAIAEVERDETQHTA